MSYDSEPEPAPQVDWDPAKADLAGPGRRSLAYVLDFAVLVLCTVVVFFNQFIEIADSNGGFVDVPPEVRYGQLLIAAVLWIPLIALRGQTIGKVILGIQVVDIATGERPSWGQSVLRWSLPWMPQAIPGVGLLAYVVYLWIFIDDNRQGWHDKLAGTIVIST